MGPKLAASRGGAEGRGRGRGRFPRQFFKTTAGTAAGSSAGRRLKQVPAVPPKQMKVRDWLRAYPSAEGDCVETYGKGSAALSPQEFKQYLTTNNSEFKRRLGYALSFTAATYRAAHKVINAVPAGLEALLKPEDKTSHWRVLVNLHQILKSPQGRAFLKACDFLDSKNVMERQSADVQKHVLSFLTFFAEAPKLAATLKQLANHSSKLFLCATWGLEAKACAGDVETWAVGFPAEKEMVALLPKQVRLWLRRPKERALLLKALVACASEHLLTKGAKTAKAGWDDAAEEEADDGEQVPDGEDDEGAPADDDDDDEAGEDGDEAEEMQESDAEDMEPGDAAGSNTAGEGPVTASGGPSSWGALASAPRVGNPAAAKSTAAAGPARAASKGSKAGAVAGGRQASAANPKKSAREDGQGPKQGRAPKMAKLDTLLLADLEDSADERHDPQGPEWAPETIALLEPWALADVQNARATLDDFMAKLSISEATPDDFTELLKTIPEDVRVARKLNLKVEGRVRLPQNMETITERLVLIIDEASKFHESQLPVAAEEEKAE